MNIFNFLKYREVEDINKNELSSLAPYVYRLAEKRNGKFVLLNAKGNKVTGEFDFISDMIEGFRIAKASNGKYFAIFPYSSLAARIYVFQNEGEKYDDDKQKEDGRHFSAEKIDFLTTQLNYRLSLGGFERSVFINYHNIISKIYTRVSPVNKHGMRLCTTNSNSVVCFTSEDGLDILFSYRFSKEENYENGVTVFRSNRDCVFVPKDFERTPLIFTDVKQIAKGVFVATKNDETQVLLDSNGKQITRETYRKIANPNKINEIIASTEGKKGNVILSRDGVRYKKFKGDFKVICDSPIGIKALQFSSEKNKSFLASIHPYEKQNCQEINANANRILIALLNGKKPETRFFNNLVRTHQVDELIKSEEYYFSALDKIKSSNPELEEEVEKLKVDFHNMLANYLKNRISAQNHIKKCLKNKHFKQTAVVDETKQKLDDVSADLSQIESATEGFGIMND